jgi:hypothetical protein
MTDEEIIIYLHDLAREFQLDKMRVVADRFSELLEMSKETDKFIYRLEQKMSDALQSYNQNVQYVSDWQKMKDQGS